MTYPNEDTTPDELINTIETFDAKDPASWPTGSYAANERDLAYMLDDSTMEFYNTMTEYHDENYASWHLFNLLMMHKAAFLALIELGGNEPATALELRLQVQADANDGSGDWFHRAMTVRLAAWTQLQDLVAQFRTKQV